MGVSGFFKKFGLSGENPVGVLGFFKKFGLSCFFAKKKAKNPVGVLGIWDFFCCCLLFR